MFETLNYTLNWFGLLFQIAGVAIGVYVFTQIKYKEGIFDPTFFDQRIFDVGDDASNLPKHPKTKKPVFPLEYNKRIATVSVICLVVGLTLQIIALNIHS